MDESAIQPSPDRQRAVAEFLVPALLSDTARVTDIVGRLAACVETDVCCSSPSLFTTTRTELVTALVDGDDAITTLSVVLSGLALVGHRCFVEWAVLGRFSHATFVHDDVMIEPSGREVAANGVMALTFRGERVGDIRCYYDPLDLQEQLVTPEVPN